MNVYDAYGGVIEYLSGDTGRVRSWCLVGPTGNLVEGWHSVSIEDVSRFLPLPSVAQ